VASVRTRQGQRALAQERAGLDDAQQLRNLREALADSIANGRLVVVGRGTESVSATQVTFSNPAGTDVSTRDIALQTGLKNVIPHGLGRAMTGRLIVYQSANSWIWDDSVDAGDVAEPERYLALQCTADVTVRLWVWLCLSFAKNCRFR
jgi:hypothetical protein